MSFFEPRDPPEPVDPSPQPYVPPIWTGPSRLELGSLAPIELLLAKTDDIAVTLDTFRCYRNGFSMNLGFQVRPGAMSDDDLGVPMHFRRAAPRLGVEFADGRRTGRRANPMEVPKDELGVPTEPVIWPGGGGGGQERWDWRMWVWPLPPRGDLTFHFAWPERDVEEAQHIIDGDLMVDASERSIQLWASGEVIPHQLHGHFGGGGTSIVLGRAEAAQQRDDEDA
jgi:hypothetical protein